MAGKIMAQKSTALASFGQKTKYSSKLGHAILDSIQNIEIKSRIYSNERPFSAFAW